MSGSNPAPSAHRQVAGHTVWNLLGYVLPLGVAFIALPPTIEHLGATRYGLFVLVMLVHDYLGYFDFGLGRAATRYLAETLADPATRGSSRSVLATCVTYHLGLGLLLGGLFALAVPFLTPWLLGHSQTPIAESRATLLAAATFGPVLLTLIATRGALEALQRFDVVNIVKIPANALTYLLPWYGATHGYSLAAIVLMLAGMRALTALVYLVTCARLLPTGSSYRIHSGIGRSLFAFGGHIMSASIAGMLLVDGDRAVVSAIAGESALTFYSVPQDLVTRLWILPASVASALFPLFATSRKEDRPRMTRVFVDAYLYSGMLLVPAVILAMLLGHWFLAVWLDPGFAAQAAIPLTIIAVGVLLDSLNRVPLTYLQATGAPEVVSRVRWLLVPPFLAASALGVYAFGITGAAIAWTARIALETAWLTILATRRRGLEFDRDERRRLGHAAINASAVLALAYLGMRQLPDAVGPRVGFAALLLIATGLHAWRTVVRPSLRDRAWRLLGR